MYATTKRGVGYFTKSIAKEYRASPLVIGLVSPRVVATELLTKDLYEPGSAAFRKRLRSGRLQPGRYSEDSCVVRSSTAMSSMSQIRSRACRNPKVNFV